MHAIPELDRDGLRRFGLTTGLIIVVLFGAIFPWLFGAKFPLWPWILFAVLALVSLVAPNGLQLVYRLWMRFGLIMSKVTTPLIMGLVFFLVITPAALVMKMIGRDPMNREVSANEKMSYRIESHKAKSHNIERPF